MKIKISVKLRHGKRVIQCVAKIIKSKKHNIPRSIQKTWRVYTDLGEPDAETKAMFHRNAKRWQHSWMMAWFGTPERFPQQMEIQDESHAESNQTAPMPMLSQGGLVSGGQVDNPVHEGSEPKAEGPVGQ